LLANDFVFSRHKALQERAAFEHVAGSSCVLAVLRPCTIVGPGAQNFLLDFFRRSFPPVPIVGNPHWQFLHESDFTEVVCAVLRARGSGVYNVTPDDAVPLRQAVRLLGGTPVTVPRRLLMAATMAGWQLRLPFVPGPSSALEFLRQPPLVTSTRLGQLGVSPRSSRDALLSARGLSVWPTRQ
jgi:nucleoside-diphosphate-sugar epimerase